MYKNLKRYYKPPIFIGGFFIYTIMKNIKTYKIFESQVDSAGWTSGDLNGAKEAVDDSLLELKDNKFNIIIDGDRFSNEYKDVRCFSLYITLPVKNEWTNQATLRFGGLSEQSFFNFQDVMDNIWQAIHIASDYGFDVYVLSFNTKKVINGVSNVNLIWSPLDVSNLEEILESLDEVNSITVSFFEKGNLKEMIEENKKSLKLSPPGIEYK